MKILEFPTLRQTYNYDCGAKVMEAVLAYYGVDINEEKIINLARTTKKGTPVEGLINVAKHFKLKCESKKLNISDLKKFIDKKVPVIILIQAWPIRKVKDWKKNWKDGHYVVVIGYDKNKIYFQDPSSISRTYLSYKELEERWHDIDLREGKKYIKFGIIINGRRKYSSKKFLHMD